MRRGMMMIVFCVKGGRLCCPAIREVGIFLRVSRGDLYIRHRHHYEEHCHDHRIIVRIFMINLIIGIIISMTRCPYPCSVESAQRKTFHLLAPSMRTSLTQVKIGVKMDKFLSVK